MAYCTSCGAQLLERATFCSGCGALALTSHPGVPHGLPSRRRSRLRSVLIFAGIALGSIFILLVIAAILVPLLANFNGGQNGDARFAELDSVQTSIYVLMVDNDLSSVAASAGKTRIEHTLDFDPGPATLTLTEYLLQPSTKYCYEWDKTGLITAQYDIDDEGACSDTGLFISLQ